MTKIYLLKHTGANLSRNLAAISLADSGVGWIAPKAVHAFLRRKEAAEYRKQVGAIHYEILTVELPRSTQDARRTKT